MNSSFLYHAWGLYAHECTREEYNFVLLFLTLDIRRHIRQQHKKRI